MKCKKCGKDVSGKFSFCPFCGTEIEKTEESNFTYLDWYTTVGKEDFIKAWPELKRMDSEKIIAHMEKKYPVTLVWTVSEYSKNLKTSAIRKSIRHKFGSIDLWAEHIKEMNINFPERELFLVLQEKKAVKSDLYYMSDRESSSPCVFRTRKEAEELIRKVDEILEGQAEEGL